VHAQNSIVNHSPRNPLPNDYTITVAMRFDTYLLIYTAKSTHDLLSTHISLASLVADQPHAILYPIAPDPVKVSTHAHTSMNVCVCMCVYVCVGLCIGLCMCACVCAFVCVCV